MQTTDASKFFRTESEFARDEARKAKAERTKDLGTPLVLPGKILSLKVRASEAWTAESSHVVRRISLETGKTLQIFKGHTAPVTCLTFHEPGILFSGSWDKTIKAWRIPDKTLLSSTPAHSDFVKTLIAIPSLAVLVSGSSDKVVRFWDLAADLAQPLKQLGAISAHTRPVEVLAYESKDDTSPILYTADTMGVIKVWALERKYGADSGCRGLLIAELDGHRSGVNDLWVGEGFVWSASNDESVLIQPFRPSSAETNPPLKPQAIIHSSAVKAILPVALTSIGEPLLVSASGELIRVYSYDVATPETSPVLLGGIDAHWHDVTALALWPRIVNNGGCEDVDTWILSASLDATIRRWRLKDILEPQSVKSVQRHATPPPATRLSLTEEEERELEELLQDD